MGYTVVFTVDCVKADENMKLAPGRQYEMNVLALDHPLKYVRMALEGSMQN